MFVTLLLSRSEQIGHTAFQFLNKQPVGNCLQINNFFAKPLISGLVHTFGPPEIFAQLALDLPRPAPKTPFGRLVFNGVACAIALSAPKTLVTVVEQLGRAPVALRTTKPRALATIVARRPRQADSIQAIDFEDTSTAGVFGDVGDV